MAAFQEIAQNNTSTIFKIQIGAERKKKTLAAGFVNGERTVLALMEKPREIEVFPGMLGSFSVPIRSIRYRKFIDFKPQR